MQIWCKLFEKHSFDNKREVTLRLPSLSSRRRASPRAGALLGRVGQWWRLPARPVRKRALWEAPSPRQPAQGGGSDPSELAVWAPLQRLPIRAGEAQSVGPDQPLCAAGEMQSHICLFFLEAVQLAEEMALVVQTVPAYGWWRFILFVTNNFICHRFPFVLFMFSSTFQYKLFYESLNLMLCCGFLFWHIL